MATDAPAPDQDREDVAGPGDLARPEVRAELIDTTLGHHATMPAEIPAKGWWQVLKRVWRETTSDRMSMMAASCAFYAMLALFPAISVLISLYGLVLDPSSVEGQLQAVRDILPAAAYDLVAQRVHDLAAKGSTTLSWGVAIGFLFALWSATAGTKALINALNIAYEEEEKRSFLRLNLVAIAMTLCGIVGVSVALSVIVGVPAALRLENLGPAAGIAVRLLSFLLLIGCVVVGLSVLYRFGPDRHEARWHWITPGSILAGVLWLLASLLFSFYVGHFASYDVTYGSLGAVVIVLMWFYISAFVVMLGAELNAELELQTKQDTTTGPARPMGQRGAYVADHVAVAE
ncbi:YihY/virulence factor BrkB family protein [Benzoatithermus flavus]|uniref:YihY/virulence factor BrkB family protein n=1 Tax=Benzoatithermus flavus TaxID=3108223 RepID=A0ABU8XU24_9PROT